MKQSAETKLEYNQGAKFYLTESFSIGITPFPAGTIVTILKCPSGDNDAYSVQFEMPTGSNINIHPSNLSRECFEKLPLAPDRRKGDVSPENPLSLKRAKAIANGAEMRSPEEERIRDLTVKALRTLMNEDSVAFANFFTGLIKDKGGEDDDDSASLRNRPLNPNEVAHG